MQGGDAPIVPSGGAAAGAGQGGDAPIVPSGGAAAGAGQGGDTPIVPSGGAAAGAGQADPSSKTLQFFVKMLTHKTITLEMSLLSTVADVKARIYSKEGIRPECQCLIHPRKPLDDERTLAELGIQPGCTLQLTAHLCGGGAKLPQPDPSKYGILSDVHLEWYRFARIIQGGQRELDAEQSVDFCLVMWRLGQCHLPRLWWEEDLLTDSEALGSWFRSVGDLQIAAHIYKAIGHGSGKVPVLVGPVAGPAAKAIAATTAAIAGPSKPDQASHQHAPPRKPPESTKRARFVAPPRPAQQQQQQQQQQKPTQQLLACLESQFLQPLLQDADMVSLACTCKTLHQQLEPLLEAGRSYSELRAQHPAQLGSGGVRLLLPAPGCRYVYTGMPAELSSFQGCLGFCHLPVALEEVPAHEGVADLTGTFAKEHPLHSLGLSSDRRIVETAAVMAAAVRQHPAAAPVLRFLDCMVEASPHLEAVPDSEFAAVYGQQRMHPHGAAREACLAHPRANPHTRRDTARGLQRLRLGVRILAAKDVAAAAAARSLLALQSGSLAALCAVLFAHALCWFMAHAGAGSRCFTAVPRGGCAAHVRNFHGVPLAHALMATAMRDIDARAPNEQAGIVVFGREFERHVAVVLQEMQPRRSLPPPIALPVLMDFPRELFALQPAAPTTSGLADGVLGGHWSDMSLLRSLRVERARQLWQCVLEDASPFRIAHPSVAAVIHSRWCLHGPDWAPDGTAALLVGAARSGAEPPQDAAVALHEAATRLRRESELDSWLAVVGQIRRRPQAAGALEAACSPSAAREALAAELAWQQQHRLVGDELALARELYRAHGVCNAPGVNMALVLGEAALCMQPAYSTVAAALAAMRGSPEQAAHVPHLEAFMAAVRSEASPYRAALLDGEQAALDGEELDSQEAEAQRWRAAAAAAKDFTPEQQAASHHFWTAYRVRVASDRAAAAGHPGLNATVWVDGSLQRVQPGAAKAEPMLAYQHGGECGLWLELDGVVWRELAGGVWLELGGDVWHERRGAVRCSCLAPNSTPVVGRAQPRSPTSVPRAHIALPTCAPPPILTRPLPAPPIRPHAGLKGRATANSMPRTPEQGQRQAASRADTMWLMSQVLAGTAGSASAAVAAAAGGMASTAAADPATARTKLVHAVLSTGYFKYFGLGAFDPEDKQNPTRLREQVGSIRDLLRQADAATWPEVEFVARHLVCRGEPYTELLDEADLEDARQAAENWLGMEAVDPTDSAKIAAVWQAYKEQQSKAAKPALKQARKQKREADMEAGITTAGLAASGTSR